MQLSVKKLLPLFVVNWYHRFLPFLGAFLYGFPSRSLKVIGVTGTCGKSTVVMMVSQILEEAGYKVASVSSIRFKIGEKEWRNDLKMTMPGRMKLQKFLRQAVNSGCQCAVLEVTSEGILQHRHSFINFDTAVFTNLTPEHIERHGGFEKYRQAKGELFRNLKSQNSCLIGRQAKLPPGQQAGPPTDRAGPPTDRAGKATTKNPKLKKVSIVNIDDENAEYFLQFPSDQKFCYSLKNDLEIESLKIDWKLKIDNWKFIKAVDIQDSRDGINFTVDNTHFELNLLGGFNVYNALAAICVGLAEDVDLLTCKRALEKIKKVPGRMETVLAIPFKVVVDYAHTPDALRKVYETLLSSKLKSQNLKPQLKNQNFSRKLICVLGSCGGGRDKWKRPVFGKIASQYCDQIILTNEDPYDENPQQIIEDIKKGISVNQRIDQRQSAVYEALDRRIAIKKALALANPGDTVIIIGKGSEPWMCVADGKKNPWDDRRIVQEEFGRMVIEKKYESEKHRL